MWVNILIVAIFLVIGFFYVLGVRSMMEDIYGPKKEK